MTGTSLEPHSCPLCLAEQSQAFASAQQRRYLICRVCDLVWLCPKQRLDAKAERAHYDTHENDPADAGYRRFLDRLAQPLIQHLPAGARGLDYGSGPGPTLSLMLEEQGYSMTIYDPFFAPDYAALARTYDFITCTEAAEHFFTPAVEFARFDRLLRPGGRLGLMTALRPEDRDFGAWHYVRDPTHVCFYSRVTLRWIADQRGWLLETLTDSIGIFRKISGSEVGP